MKHPHLFEINTRVLLSTLSRNGCRATLDDIPAGYWEALAARGIQWIWLMGVWQLREVQINPSTISDELLAQYKSAFPAISRSDVDGSTYAIDAYIVDPVIGGHEALARLRKTLHLHGMRLMLDFIPNHFGANSECLIHHPNVFLQVDRPVYDADRTTFYEPLVAKNKYFAHGKDPYFDAWQDTAQVNYANPEARKYMTHQLLGLAEMCDGVRCDMAMLAVRQVFMKTWGDHVQWQGEEFWPAAIASVKEAHPQFVLMAEVYWDMEWELIQMGFDYCYDKTFYDRLTDPPALIAHMGAEPQYLRQTARFLENHDEARIASRLSSEQHMAAAALVAFGPGMRFWHMGQWEGVTEKLPVQITHAPESLRTHIQSVVMVDNNATKHLAGFYASLFSHCNEALFQQGECVVYRYLQTIIYDWTLEERRAVVLINYSEEPSRCTLPEMDDAMRRIFPEGPANKLEEIWPWGLCIWMNGN